jgi:hypothetical protein
MRAPATDMDLHDPAALVRGFEDGSLDVAVFHHRQHLIVAAWLLETSNYDSALTRMRKGLHGLLSKVGKDAYHETVTVFWMRALRHRLSTCDRMLPVDQRIREVVAWAQTGQPLRAHYSAELLASGAAKREFVAPDLAPLPGLQDRSDVLLSDSLPRTWEAVLTASVPSAE